VEARLLEIGLTSSLGQKKMYVRQLSEKTPKLSWEQRVLEYREKVCRVVIAIPPELGGLWKMVWSTQHLVETSYLSLMLCLYWTLHCHLLTVSA
jgi:hypothetical protein